MNIYIIGASKGIGAGIAEAFAKLGHNLFLASRDMEGLIKFSAEISQKYQVECNYNYVDVSDKLAISNSFQKCLDKIGTPDIVIYNSGISRTDDFNNFDAQVIKDVFRVNFTGMLDAMEAILPTLLKADKEVIFAGTSSLAECRGLPGNAGYTASKIAASHVLEAARCQLYNSNVKIITIKPGFVHTNMTNKNQFPMPMVINADRAGEIIVDGLLKGKSIVAFPKLIQFFTSFAKSIPSIIYDNVMKHWTKKKILQD